MDPVIQVNPRRAAILQQRKVVNLEEEITRIWARLDAMSRVQEEQGREIRRLRKAIEKIQSTLPSASSDSEKIALINSARSLEEDIDGLWQSVNEILAIMGLKD